MEWLASGVFDALIKIWGLDSRKTAVFSSWAVLEKGLLIRTCLNASLMNQLRVDIHWHAHVYTRSYTLKIELNVNNAFSCVKLRAGDHSFKGRQQLFISLKKEETFMPCCKLFFQPKVTTKRSERRVMSLPSLVSRFYYFLFTTYNTYTQIDKQTKARIPFAQSVSKMTVWSYEDVFARFLSFVHTSIRKNVNKIWSEVGRSHSVHTRWGQHGPQKHFLTPAVRHFTRGCSKERRKQVQSSVTSTVPGILDHARFWE